MLTNGPSYTKICLHDKIKIDLIDPILLLPLF